MDGSKNSIGVTRPEGGAEFVGRKQSPGVTVRGAELVEARVAALSAGTKAYSVVTTPDGFFRSPSEGSIGCGRERLAERLLGHLPSELRETRPTVHDLDLEVPTDERRSRV